MSVQINCCPVKGRDRFRRLHQRARLACVQLPACTQGHCWPLLTLAPRPDLVWVNAGHPGWGHRRPGCQQTGQATVSQAWGSCPHTLLTCLCDIWKSQAWCLGLAVVLFPMHVPADWVMRYWDLSFQRLWDELGSSYGLRRCFSSSVAQFGLKRRRTLVLNFFQLCLLGACAVLMYVREAAVLQQGQKNLKALLAQAS